MRHKYEKVTVRWSFSTVLNKHNLIVKNLGIILFLQRFIQLLVLMQFLLPFCLKGTLCSLIWELLLLMQSLLWFCLNQIFMFSLSFFFLGSLCFDFVWRGVSYSLHLRRASSHAIFGMILFRGKYHVFIVHFFSCNLCCRSSVWRGISIVSSSSLSLCNLHCCAHLVHFTLRRAASKIGIQKSACN
jgi:hypothetical protein